MKVKGETEEFLMNIELKSRNAKKPERDHKFCGTTVPEFSALYRIPIFKKQKDCSQADCGC